MGIFLSPIINFAISTTLAAGHLGIKVSPAFPQRTVAKIHEVLVSEEECYRTVARENYYAIQPILPELRSEEKGKRSLTKEYSSSDHTINSDTLSDILKTAGYI